VSSVEVVPAVPALLAPAVVELGGVVFVIEAVAVVTVAVVGVRALAAVVTVRVVAGAELSEPPASLTSAAASTPRERTATTNAVTRGAFQFGDAASRVRAAAPQVKHHS
jgi:hypothetical protein